MMRVVLKCLVLFLMLYACSGSEETQEPAYIEVSPNGSLVYENQGGEALLTVKSNGDWSVSGETDWCKAVRTGGSSSQQVKVTVSAVTENKDRETKLVFTCREAKATISVKQYGAVEFGYIDLGFDNPSTTVNFNASTGAVTVRSNAVPSAVRKGRAIVLPAKYNFAIRVVESSKVGTDEVVLQTKAGDMNDLFNNIDFKLATSSAMASGDAILPTEVGFISADGSYQKVSDAEKANKENSLFYLHKEYRDYNLYKNGNDRFYWEECYLDTQLQGLFEFSFGQENSADGVRGSLNSFSCGVKGNMTTDLKLKYTFGQTVQQEIDEQLEQNVARKLVFKFMVGKVPVYLQTRGHLNRYASIEAKGSATVSYGAKAEAPLEMGVKWMKGGVSTLTSAYTPAYTLHAPSYETQGSFSGAASFYPVMEFDLYQHSGATLKAVPYLKEDMKSSEQQYDAKRYPWSSTVEGGLQVAAESQFAFAVPNATKWTSGKQTAKNQSLMESPKRITLTSADNVAVRGGRPLSAKFKVESLNALTQEYLPCAGAVVSFETPTLAETKSLVSDANGEVLLEWTPGEVDGTYTLKAAAVADKGEKVSEAEFHYTVNSKVTPAEMVDLGLSVMWATWNVGAHAPEEVGEYFAWGETEGKSEYSKDTYKFYEDKNGNENMDPDEFTYMDNIQGNTQYDPAREQWGGKWRMPTESELKELLDDTKIKAEWTLVNGVGGRRFTSLKNGNSIFIPANGYYTSPKEGGFGYKGVRAFYWSGNITIEGDNKSQWKAARLYFCSQYKYTQSDYRYYGGGIRPVCDK